MKASKILVGTIAAVVIAAGALLITGIPAGFLNSTIRDRIARETGYRATIAGSTRIGMWPSLKIAMNEVTLEVPNDNGGHRIIVGSVEAIMTPGSLWSPQPDISELVIKHPMVTIPLLRERRPSARAEAPTQAESARDRDAASRIDRITITDGEVTFSNARDHFERHIAGIGLDALISADRRLNLTGSARAQGHPIAFEVKASVPGLPLDRQTIPLELSIDAPDLLGGRLASKAALQLNGMVAMINGISATIGDGAFSGWASIDFASKPRVELGLDFARLDVGAASASAVSKTSASWSNATIEMTALNYVDAQFRLSAAELNVGKAHFAPAAIEGGIENGLVKCVISNLGAYEGLANGQIDIDVSHGTPAYTIRSDLTGVRALPLLRAAADFDKLDGKLSARIAVRSEGQNQQEIMSNVRGTASVNFRDGAIRGLNVAQMIRSLISGPRSGWQGNSEQSTDLTQLSASFRIDKGQAETSDINLVGPLVKMTGAGTIDLGRQTLALRGEPKLVMTTKGQGRSSDPIGFGIPVVIEGPWADPRISADIGGILDNSGGGNGLDSLGAAIGNLIQQGLNGRRRAAPPDATPDDSSRRQDSQPLNDIMKQLFGR